MTNTSAQRLYPATVVVTEAHWDESVSYQIDQRYLFNGMFTIEDLASTYGGAWAMDRDIYSSKVTFDSRKKITGKPYNYRHQTEYYYQMDDSVRKAAWSVYSSRV